MLSSLSEITTSLQKATLEDAPAGAPARKATSLSRVSTALQGRKVLPIAEFGTLGEALADGLPLFSLDLVALVAEYALYKGEDLCFTDGLIENSDRLRKQPGNGLFRHFSGPLQRHCQEMGPFVVGPLSLNCCYQDHSTYFYSHDFSSSELEKHIIPHFVNLRSLQIRCTAEAALLLHKLPRLCHLELLEDPMNEKDFEIFARSFPALRSLTLHGRAAENPIVTKMKNINCFQYFNVTELSLVSPGCVDPDLCAALQKMPRLEKLHFYIPTFNYTNLENIPVKELCIESCYFWQQLTLPKTLQKIIFRHCLGVLKKGDNWTWIRSQCGGVNIECYEGSRKMEVAEVDAHVKEYAQRSSSQQNEDTCVIM